MPHCGWMYFPPHDNIARFLREGWCDYREQALLWRVLRPGDAFVDVGAHAGLYSLLALQAVGPNGRVTAIEPNPRIHPYLEQNLGRAIAAGRANLFKTAVNSAPGQAQFQCGPDHQSSFSRLAAGTAHPGSIPVEVTTLDDILSQGDEIACLKLDVEGAEIGALEGLRSARARVRMMLMEVNENNLRAFGGTTQGMLSVVESSGFRLCRWDGKETLAPVQYSGPIWYENIIAVADPEWAAKRLRTAPPERMRIAAEVLKRGAASADLHSGELHMSKDAALDSLEVARAEAMRAQQRALEAECRADIALRQSDEAWARLGEANWRADEAMKRVDEALGRIREADSRTDQALMRAKRANERADAIRRAAEEQVRELQSALDGDSPELADARRLVRSRVVAAYVKIFMPDLHRHLVALRTTPSRTKTG